MEKKHTTVPQRLRAGNTRSRLLRWLLLFLLLCGGFARSSAAAGISSSRTSGSASGYSPTFAIADLDGDAHPDFADIQAGRIGSFLTDYRIQLQLTQSGRRAIQLVAPSGGLLIEARDVDGDHSIDLVVSTAWFKSPVAVFLNDGHGSFLRAEPSTFPNAFVQTSTRGIHAFDRPSDFACVPSQPRHALCTATGRAWDLSERSNAIAAPTGRRSAHTLLVASAGRAPPRPTTTEL